MKQQSIYSTMIGQASGLVSMGPENLTLLETTAILSQVLDLPLEYVQVTIESIQQRLGSMGATSDVQREMGSVPCP